MKYKIKTYLSPRINQYETKKEMKILTRGQKSSNKIRIEEEWILEDHNN